MDHGYQGKWDCYSVVDVKRVCVEHRRSLGTFLSYHQTLWIKVNGKPQPNSGRTAKGQDPSVVEEGSYEYQLQAYDQLQRWGL